MSKFDKDHLIQVYQNFRLRIEAAMEVKGGFIK